MSWSPPTEFDGYRLIRTLGRGRMGHVHLAEDTVLRRPVAVKFLSRGNATDDGAERLLVEARAIARLQHSNVVAIYRVGAIDDHPYLVSEYVRGEPLDRLPRPVPPEQVLRIAIGLSRGLAEAHRHGVLHRDIKPANAILSEDGEAKLLDFGLAKFTDDPSGHPLRPRTPVSLTVVPTAKPSVLAATLPSPSGAAVRMEVLRGGLDEPEPVPSGAADQTVSLVGEAKGVPSPQLASSGRPHELTREGAVIGTPLYMAPEAWRGEASTFRSDVYSLGALLFHLCVGHPVHDRDTLPELRQACLDEDSRPVAELAPHLDRSLAQVIDRCLRRQPVERYASGEALRRALEPLAPERQFAAIPEGNPYRGLHTFEAEHRGLFFGRDAEIRGVLEALRAQPFMLVAGDSGVGKSSLCRAAVLPAVREGILRGGRTWKTVSLVPGRRPVSALVAALALALGVDEKTLHDRLIAEPQGAGREVRRLLGDTVGLLIFVDQLEELLTVSDPTERAQAAQLLGWLAEPAPGIGLLATVRGDFLTRLASLPGLGEQVSRALFILRPMERANIREAIVGPARATGVAFETDTLIESLADTTVDAEGGLPLLQFALAELWDARDPQRKVMTEASLAAIGGVTGALARHGDSVIAGLLTEQRASARRVLLELVTADSTRARRPEAELIAGDPVSRPAIDALVRSRLLVARDSDAGPMLEVAHEALIRGWPTLHRWIELDVETRALRERLAQAASEWERLGHSKDSLWSTRQLTEVAPLTESLLPARSIAFLEATRAALARSRRRRRLGLAVAPLLPALIWGVVELKSHRDVARVVSGHLERAAVEMTEAQRLRGAAEEARTSALAQFDARNNEDGEHTWSRWEGLSSQAAASLGEVSSDLEAALAVDPSRTDVRERFGDLLLDQVLLADAAGARDRREELLKRLRLYDPDETRLKKYNSPGTLTVRTSPASARLGLVRFDPETGAETTHEDLGQGPLPERSLEPGSYLLTLDAAGRVPARLPFLIRRGEAIHATLDLPPEEAVPEGFVYIPAGRFLLGATGPEMVRKNFLATVPEHEVATEAYLIARRETTFGEWLEYLRALPAERRAGLLAKSAESGFTGHVELSEAEGGRFKLTIQTGPTRLTALEGDRIEFSGRDRRRKVDWLRMPASGISFTDAQDYTSWLASSGRVPGARLCTELEWERAARGADGRPYPQGEVLEPDAADFDETYHKDQLAIGPDEVGSHPQSRSVFGLDDMVGNVWELTQAAIGHDVVVARGGSYAQDAFTNTSNNRQVVDVTQRDVTLGLRVCATPRR